jgi:hypothetical protein
MAETSSQPDLTVPKAVVVERLSPDTSPTSPTVADSTQQSDTILDIFLDPRLSTDAGAGVMPETPGSSLPADWQYVLRHASQPLRVRVRMQSDHLLSGAGRDMARPVPTRRAKQRTALLDIWLEAKAEAFSEEG